MKKTAIILAFCFIGLALHSQDPAVVAPVFPRYNIGFGAGIDYGGFGGRFTVLTSQRLEFFGAVGYNLLGIGLNAGVDLRLMPMSRICPYLGAMYGYNAVIKIIGSEINNQTYYGPSFNLGLEFWNRRNTNFFNIELIVPIRPSDYHNDIKNLKNNPNIILKNEPPPIGISLGYHFAF
jgi:hypothetical protein